MFLLSESDFVNYNVLKPNPNVPVEYDFIYSCPKVDENSSCNDWVSYNKNWELALKCLPIMCLQFKLRGLLVGRSKCTLPVGCEKLLDTTGWVDYYENIKLYNKCKFIFVPNIRDASPRVLTEALACGLPCLVNYNILGGWKYVDSVHTGEFFTDETDIAESITILLKNMSTYNPRQYIIDNYGPINSGKQLKNFLYSNFNDKINVPITDVNYVVFRGPLTGFVP
jgi:glycosyltransferase involved in cell wall biosynthesis